MFEKTYNNFTMNSNIYTVGAATNLNLYMDLKLTQDINLVNYDMATEGELGHYYKYFNFKNDYNSNFLFIGKNNKVIGKLDYLATQEQIENMFNLTLASFEGIYKREPIQNMILSDDVTSLDLNDYFYTEEGKNVEFNLVSNSNTLAVEGNIVNRTLELTKGEYTGSSKLTLQIKVPDKDIAFYTDFYVFVSKGESEDFEYSVLTESIIPWENDREAWFVTDESSFTGDFSIRSGAITDDRETSLSLTMNIEKQDYISFAYKISSETDNDLLSFYVDSVLVNYQDPSSLWSGVKDWRVVTYNLRPGVRTFTWTYSKNYLGSIGFDCAWLDAIVLPASTVATDIEDRILPSSLELTNYPNPFNPTTTIDFSLDRSSVVELNVYDINGSLVNKLHSGFTNTGKYSFEFNGKNLSSGIYYAVLKTQEKQKISKMILVK
ncbi:MAG: T9SS type A sorting domain-containing protein [Candidatus Delongbacteria bacterium]|nr:T9SS type A sorting domain-containing protein [Candidatus Delongbacteria bacterium]